MKTLILTWAILIITASPTFDKWYYSFLVLFAGMLILELYHSKWFKNKTKKED